MKRYISKVWIDSERVYAQTEDGLVASYAFSEWKGLAGASSDERNDFYLSYTGIHWPQLDEDLSFEGMFAAAGLCDRTESEDSVCCLE